MARVSRVLIVGGGIGGATLAIALAGHGVEVEIAEIQDEWRPVGVGLTLLGPALRALRTIGLIDRAVADGSGVLRLAIGDASSRIGHVSELPRLNGPQYPSAIQISRPAFHRILEEAARGRGVRVRTGISVAALHQAPDGITAELTDGSSCTVDLVVGADGVHSRVRMLLMGPEPAPQFTGQAVWRAMVPRPTEAPPGFEQGTLYMFFGSANKAGLLPVSPREIYVFLVQNTPQKVRPEDSALPALMREQLAEYSGFLGELRERIVEPAQVVYRSLEILLVPPPWHRGRAVLIGDAAHTTTPHLAHGGGLAIEDAVVLADLLTAAPSVEEALDQFTPRRWERCRMVVENSVQLGEWEKRPSPEADPAALTNASWAALAEPI
jgi:2-polyprenyl-6-methoxyphenol hydroxylase-like FAD-dependent oxidoreductase